MADITETYDLIDRNTASKQSRFNIRVPLRDGKSLLFNSLREQLVLLSSDEVARLDGRNDSQDSPEQQRFAKLLAAGGFIVHESLDEAEAVKRRFNSRRTSKANLTITIVTTLGCNLACGYCFQGKDKANTRITGEARDGLAAFVQRKLEGLAQLNIVWFGGEPLMNAAEIWRTSTLLREICSASEVRYSATIVTNGYLLTEEVARKLVAEGVHTAQVTIDGTASAHDRMRPHISGRGTFDRIIKNVIAALQVEQFSVSLRISVDASNAEDIRSLLEYLAEQGLGGRDNFSVYFAPIEAISAGCTDYEELTLSKRAYASLEVELINTAVTLGLKHLGQFGQDLSLCQAVRPGDIVLNPNGDLHKCWDTVAFDRLKVANIADADFDDKIENNQWTEWQPTAHPICASCKILPICGGGCAFKSVHSTEQAGEAATLPCISLKFNLAERLFQVALASGVVEPSDWDPDLSPTFVGGELKTGRSHFAGSLRAVPRSVEA